MRNGAERILAERNSHLEIHKLSVEDDKANNKFGELALAARILISSEHLDVRKALLHMPENWDTKRCLQMLSKSYEERLVIAGSLIAGEIDRIS